jgi:hypothetical protein
MSQTNGVINKIARNKYCLADIFREEEYAAFFARKHTYLSHQNFLFELEEMLPAG